MQAVPDTKWGARHKINYTQIAIPLLSKSTALRAAQATVPSEFSVAGAPLTIVIAVIMKQIHLVEVIVSSRYCEI